MILGACTAWRVAEEKEINQRYLLKLPRPAGLLYCLSSNAVFESDSYRNGSNTTPAAMTTAAFIFALRPRPDWLWQAL